MELIKLKMENVTKSSFELHGKEAKNNFYNSYHKDCLVSVFVIGYKNFEKTKRCVESILKYTKDIDYELVLFDNNSEDETLEYFQTVEYDNLKIISSPQNMGSTFACNCAVKYTAGKYIAIVANDVYVTENWLKNMITCLESEDNVGMVVPLSSYVSNLQDPGFAFDDLDEMFEKAEKHNISNPSLWEERIRLINVCSILKREAIESVGLWDCGYIHDFSEDDYCIRLRRAGYKLYLAGDTYVYHDHIRSNMTVEQAENAQKSLKQGLEYYTQKHKLDPWNDVMAIEYNLIQLFNQMDFTNSNNSILGVDVRSGESLLWIKNSLKKKNIVNNQYFIFNSDAKYFEDNKTITSNVVIDNLQNIFGHHMIESKDIIILGKAINEYDKPIEILSRMYSLLKKNGILLFKLRNSNTYENFLSALGYKEFRNQDMLVNIEIDDVLQCLKMFAIDGFKYNVEMFTGTEEIQSIISDIFKNSEIDNNDALNKLFVKEYFLCIRKKFK